MSNKEKSVPGYYPVASDKNDRLVRDFSYHQPKPELQQQERYQEIRVLAYELAHYIVSRTPPSREQSIALTELETAVMWANAAIARNE